MRTINIYSHDDSILDFNCKYGLYKFQKSKSVHHTHCWTFVSHRYAYFHRHRCFSFDLEINVLKEKTKFTEKGKRYSPQLRRFLFVLTFRNSRMAHCEFVRIGTFPFIAHLFASQGFLKDCPTGRLNKKQLARVYQHFYPQGNVKPFCECVHLWYDPPTAIPGLRYVFTAVDKNKDGKIDFVEYLLQIVAMTHDDLNSRLATAFDLYVAKRFSPIDDCDVHVLDTTYPVMVRLIERSWPDWFPLW